MELSRVSSVGLTEMPPGFQARRRCHSLTARAVATAVLAVFILVVTVTTVVSLGSYCLTSDGSNTSGLPQTHLSLQPWQIGAGPSLQPVRASDLTSLVPLVPASPDDPADR
jgi:hypothetical protein